MRTRKPNAASAKRAWHLPAHQALRPKLLVRLWIPLHDSRSAAIFPMDLSNDRGHAGGRIGLKVLAYCRSRCCSQRKQEHAHFVVDQRVRAQTLVHEVDELLWSYRRNCHIELATGLPYMLGQRALPPPTHNERTICAKRHLAWRRDTASVPVARTRPCSDHGGSRARPCKQ